MNSLDVMKRNLKEAIHEAVLQAGIVAQDALNAHDVLLEVPKDKTHGDMATNIAMQLTKLAKRNPRQIAEAIVEHLDREKASVTQVDIAGPGFINFFLNKSFLNDVIRQVSEEGERYGNVDLGQGKTVQVEFVSANPTGSLHLGHARGAAVGDALCHLLEAAGYKVTREYYINDAGNQVTNLVRSLEARYRQALGQDASMPEDGYQGEDIVQFGQDLAKEEGDRLLRLSNEERDAFLRAYGLEKELAKIKRDLELFRVKFDVWFSETSLYEGNQIAEVLAKLRENGYIFEEEGATWLRSTAFGDDKDRVLIKNDGSFTYLTPDITYHQNKFERGFERVINIWGADHHGYIPRMKAAMQALGYDADRLVVLIAQMVSLYQNGEKVKMSKRTGKAVTMEDLMEEVGVDATRYFFAMRGMDSHLDFDMDLAVSKSNENPVFYVQYAHARICSIFRQAEEAGMQLKPVNELNLEVLDSEQDYELMRKMAELPEEISIAAEQLAPHRIIRYVYDLATMFHSYYNAQRVISEDEALTRARLALLGSVRTVIRKVLSMVGVSAPERM